MLDGFFASVTGAPALVRAASDRAFAQARARLHMPALQWLNERLIADATGCGFVPLWRGFRLVGADASVLMPGIRACHRSRTASAGQFMRGDQAEALVQLNRPSVQDAEDWGCKRDAPRVRLVRQIAPSGAIRVLATNLSAEQAPAEAFGALYHQRWRVEEAFKRLKHRLHLGGRLGLESASADRRCGGQGAG